MNPQDNNILLLAKDYATSIFQNKISPSFLFHNLEHTQSVVKACMDMADYYKLTDEDRFTLLLAAWFHDSGFSKGLTSAHEEASATIALEFMDRHKVEEPLKAKVRACILATRMPQRPLNLQEQIICDADLFHLGSDKFFEKTKALRQELVLTGGRHIQKEEWAKTNIRFLETHRYFTTYCKERLDPVKEENLRKIKKKYNIREAPPLLKEVSRVMRNADIEADSPGKNEEKKPGKIKIDRPERGIETMFRTTGSNHLKLSDMADSKAHIMISVNSVIISIIISVLLEKLDNYTNFIIPATLLLLMSVLAIVFSVLATRPHITAGTFTKEDIETTKANLLFFGNFHRMSLEDYTWGMNELMNNRNYLYNSMIKDIYYLGVVLARKYRYLRISYNIFMYGLIIAVLAFGIASFFIPDTA